MFTLYLDSDSPSNKPVGTKSVSIYSLSVYSLSMGEDPIELKESLTKEGHSVHLIDRPSTTDSWLDTWHSGSDTTSSHTLQKCLLNMLFFC